MKKIIVLAALLIFVAGAASAAIIITLNSYRGLEVCLNPEGLVGSTGDGVFTVSVSGMVLDSDGKERNMHRMHFMSNDPAYSLNSTTVTNFYRRARRAWKNDALADNTD